MSPTSIFAISGGAVFMICIAAAFPGLILVALAVKMWEVHKAKSWLSTDGVVITSRVDSQKKRPGDPGYNFSETEVSNQPFIEYEYTVNGKKLRCHRYTIGEKTADFELEMILERYPVGKAVTVYYDPAKPTNAVLERDLWTPMMFWGLAAVMLFFVGGPIIAAVSYFGAVGWLKSHLADPSRAPFVAASGGFAILVSLFSLAYHRWIWLAARWPTVTGKIVETDVEAYHDLRESEGYYRQRKMYKPSVMYSYEVNGRKFIGDRVTLGLKMASTIPGLAGRMAKKHPVGSDVEVYYNPQAPAESVLYPRAWIQYVPWLIAAGMFALSWAVATGRM